MLSVEIARTGDGTLVVSSETIAEGAGVEHRAVLQLADTHRDVIDSFGPLAFEMRMGAALPQGGFAKATRVALLNEHQATLLLTMMRNTDRVIEFKVALVRAFFDMARSLTNPLVPQSLPDALRAYALEVEAREAAEAKIAADAPKVAAYDQLMDADGYYSMEAAAKMCGLGRTTFYRRLREAGVIQNGSTLPYQRHMHHFVLTASSWTDAEGNVHPSQTTRVRPSGLPFLASKIGATVDTPA